MARDGTYYIMITIGADYGHPMRDFFKNLKYFGWLDRSAESVVIYFRVLSVVLYAQILSLCILKSVILHYLTIFSAKS